MEPENNCPGSGRPVFLDYAGPGVPAGIPKCKECHQVVEVDSGYGAMPHGWAQEA